ncbi:trypsin-like peptidase domain-containing protein [Neolewinella litorea]|uniref:Serine protease n=1 Tax=Neolewinella litorea TaxID=2562452 RepID=A0A4V3XKQ8_9BACT|nr:trypsin-like peptidase domain-containing protein [Neolewinella litorea]THH37893.1 serine protease [Neolewinella litorea]
MANWNSKLTELRGHLVELYPEKEDGRMMVEMAGIPPGSIAFSDKATSNWHNILREANKRNKVMDIVQLAIQEYPEREDLARLFTEVEEEEPLTSAAALNSVLEMETLKTLPKRIERDFPDIPTETLQENLREEIHTLETRRTERTRGKIGQTEYRRIVEGINKDLAEKLRESGLGIDRPAIAPAAPQKEDRRAFDILVPNRKGLEKVVKGDDLIDVLAWVQGAMEQSKTVCKIETSDGESGTGFLLGGGLLMTNNHVIPDAATAANTRLTFNFKTDKDNNVLQETHYRLDPTVFITSHEDELDYTIVKVVDSTETPLAGWGCVELEDFFDPQLHEKVTVIQHPRGNYMKMALPDDVISIWGKYLFYTTDTREGSSGSPVFNKHWKVVALHHAGKNEESYEGGLQIDEAGTIAPSNRGVLIKYILEDLKKRNFPLLK